MSECKTCEDVCEEDARECSICACSYNEDGRQLLFISDIYANYPNLQALCGCVRDTGKTFCSGCFLSTLKVSIAPSTSDALTLGTQTVIFEYKCPFCRDTMHARIKRLMWHSGVETFTSDNLLLFLSNETMKANPQKASKKYYLKQPDPGAEIFLAESKKERLIPLFTLRAHHSQDSMVFTLQSRIRYQRSCCSAHCSWFDIAEYKDSSRAPKKFIVCIRTPPRRSKRANATTHERPFKIAKTG